MQRRDHVAPADCPLSDGQLVSLLTNLIAHWKMDEASGDAIDAHSTHDGVENNGVASTSGVINGARQFIRANSENFAVPDHADLSPADQSFSVAAWVKIGDTTVGLQHIVDHKNASDDGFACYYNQTGTSFSLHVQGAGGATNLNHAGVNVSTATWYFVVWVYDHGNQLLKISVDGGAFETTAHTGGITATATDFYLGRYGGAATGYLDGELDSVSFWLDRVLSDADVDELYNGGAGLDYDDFDVAGEVTMGYIRPMISLTGYRPAVFAPGLAR